MTIRMFVCSIVGSPSLLPLFSFPLSSCHPVSLGPSASLVTVLPLCIEYVTIDGGVILQASSERDRHMRACRFPRAP